MKKILFLLAGIAMAACSADSSTNNKDENTVAEDKVTQAGSASMPADDTRYGLPELPLASPSKEELYKYRGLITSSAVKAQQVASTPAFEYNKQSFLDELLHFDNISKASVYYDSINHIMVHDFYYSGDCTELNFDHVVNILHDTQREQRDSYYVDFFKRGLVWTLDKEFCKASLLTFNVFDSPEHSNKIKKFFETNKERFDAVIIVMGSNSSSMVYTNNK